ncbi:DUF6273 domain-containing protein [uncultured Oscillibacter sp.]|uniref:DUF6273 domain-containing protein n=1 Tax=uncultured Oscillibacter sp. TaxID=876091 RepID=UPI00272D2568|nr:DUF6273 domain-containing protein [uncultured Oscillibacter sp.]
MFYGFVITEAGNQLLAKMVAGQTLKLSGVFMDLGTVEDKETARQLIAPLEPGPAGTSTVPTVKGNQVGMIVQFRSDLDGGLKEDKWIGGFGVYAEDPDTGDPVMIYYASLGHQRQPIAAYVEGTAPDVRNFPISIRVTSGVDATLTYPAGAWMTAEDVLLYFNETIKPELEAALAGLIEAHNTDENAHPDLAAAVAEALRIAREALEAAQAADGKADSALAAARKALEDAAAAMTAAKAAQEAAETAQKAVTDLTSTIDAVPSQSGVLTFTGAEQAPVWNNYNPAALVMTGETTGTNAGTYTATFTPVEGYKWRDGTTDAKSVTWTIGRAIIMGIPAQSGSLTYNGSAQSPVWSGHDAAKLTIGGTTSGTNAGSYNATFTPGANYQWSDGTTTAKTVAWSIGRASVGVPSQSGTLTYNGSAQSPVWSGHDAAKLTIGGTTSGTNAGSYNATFTPVSNYQWSDGSTAAKTVAWSIGKAAGSSSLNKSSLALSTGTMSGTISVTRAGNGAVSASSSNTNVATVSVSGTTVTVTAKAKGTATITVKVAEGTNHTAPANRTCSVSVTLPTTSLNDNTWATIKEVSDAGQGENYWSVGDTKRITINGKVGNFTFSNLAIDAFIIGFNHNSSREGTNRIHFQIGKIGGKDVCLCDSQYGSGQSGNGYFNMNPNNSNSGGWNGSYMRKTLLGNSGTPSSPPANSMLAALPSDLRAVMKSVTKYSDNTGGSPDNASYVTSTTDYLFLLAEFEYHGARSYANSAEKNFQLQYSYYKAGNSKVKYKHGETGTAAYHWCRSVYVGNANYFCRVYTNGSANHTNAYNSWGAAPGFAV